MKYKCLQNLDRQSADRRLQRIKRCWTERHQSTFVLLPPCPYNPMSSKVPYTQMMKMSLSV